MNIIELAKQAGFTANDEQEVFLRVYREEIERFATLIRNAVLEEAAGGGVHRDRKHKRVLRRCV